MKQFAIILFAFFLGCSQPPEIGPPTFDSSDPQGSIRRLAAGLSEADFDKFCIDCMVASTGIANVDRADKAVDKLPGHADQAFEKLNGMTADQIRKRATEIREKSG